eukprot:COSAG02_NODE_588_length_19902_cov_115.928900_11_plen_164_part_00
MYDADFIGADEFEEDSLLLSYSACFGMYFHVSPDPVSPFAQWMVRLDLNPHPHNYVETIGLIVLWATFDPVQFNDADKESAYLLHKQLIQLLSLRYQPKTCWLLKAPLHSFYPEVLLKTYPDARIIVTHRDHLEAVPSWTKFVLAHTNIMSNDEGWDAHNAAE